MGASKIRQKFSSSVQDSGADLAREKKLPLRPARKGAHTQRQVVSSMIRVSVRWYTRSRSSKGTVIRGRHGKQLQAPATASRGVQPFLFGHFAGLKQPERINQDSSLRLIEKVTNFEDLRIFPTVRLAMKEEIKQGYNMKGTYIQDKSELTLKPLPVQIAAIKKLTQSRLSGLKKQQERLGGSAILDELAVENEKNRLKVFTIAAETGSGKTWSYLAPLLLKLKEEELEIFNRSREDYTRFKKAPIIRSVILLPTHELVEQVYETVTTASAVRIDEGERLNPKMVNDPAYSDFLKLPEQRTALNLNVLKWGAGDPHTKLFDAVNSSMIDVLVTTPLKLLSLSNINKLTSSPFKVLNHVTYAVVDEADTLMDKSWLMDTSNVIKRIPRCKDLVFCSATIPREFNKTLLRMFPGERLLINVVTPSLHKIPKQIHLKVIDAELSPYNGSKTRCLAQALYAIHKDGTEQGYVKRILVFVNLSKDVEPLCDTLVTKYGQRREDIIGITGKDTPTTRLAKIAPFLKPAELVQDDPHQSQIKVLVTTDLLARGLNFNAIKNVILMDLPNTSVDLVHRVGRTGRMRQSGRVFVIINKKTGKSWIKGLPKVIKKGIPLG